MMLQLSHVCENSCSSEDLLLSPELKIWASFFVLFLFLVFVLFLFLVLVLVLVRFLVLVLVLVTAT